MTSISLYPVGDSGNTKVGQGMVWRSLPCGAGCVLSTLGLFSCCRLYTFRDVTFFWSSGGSYKAKAEGYS